MEPEETVVYRPVLIKAQWGDQRWLAFGHLAQPPYHYKLVMVDNHNRIVNIFNDPWKDIYNVFLQCKTIYFAEYINTTGVTCLIKDLDNGTVLLYDKFAVLNQDEFSEFIYYQDKISPLVKALDKLRKNRAYQNSDLQIVLREPNLHHKMLDILPAAEKKKKKKKKKKYT